jgi:hypothetical protein
LFLENGEHFPGVPLRESELDFSVPNTIERLEISFPNAISAFFEAHMDSKGLPVSITYPFEEKLPRLTSLRITQWAGIEGSFLKHLPATLTDLKLLTYGYFDIIPFTKYLPTSIISLDLGYFELCDNIDEFVFPPSLTTLVISLIPPGPSWLALLPTSLTKLEISHDIDGETPSDHFKDLPRGLKELAIRGTTDLTPEHLQNDLPPKLESLTLEFNGGCISSELLKAIPKSIKRLDFGSVVFGTEQLPLIPPSLPSIQLVMMQLSDISYLPTGLTKLDLHVLDDGIARGIHHLARLTYLGSQEGALTPEGCELLPTSLRSFSFTFSSLASYHSLSKLPPLTDLHYMPVEWHVIPLTHRGRTHFLTRGMTRILPPTLKRLNIFSHKGITGDAMKGLALLPGLEYLVLTNREWPLTESILLDLPPKLRSFSAVLTSIQREEAYMKLPKGLTYLNLASQDTTERCIDSIVKHLPRSLLFLFLPDRLYYTQEAAKDIPPNIQETNFLCK